MEEEDLIKYVFSNQLLFCALFSALGGLVHSLDINHRVKFNDIIKRIIVSALAGILIFFATYDIDKLTPAFRIAASIISGFYGSAIFRWLAKFYIKQAANALGVEPSRIIDEDCDDKKR